MSSVEELPREGKVEAIYRVTRTSTGMADALVKIKILTDLWREGKISTRKAMNEIVDIVDEAVMATWKEEG